MASTPAHFQRRISKILSELASVVCQIDDVLVIGCVREQHDVIHKIALIQNYKSNLLESL